MAFAELVDIAELQKLCDSYHANTGAVMAILDLSGNILIATGWQDICTQFHRVHSVTALRCKESDTILSNQLREGEKVNVYVCKNGLTDAAVPILIGGKHVANFFTGQFFFAQPDREYFIRQAEEFGFDKTAYLDALARVPIFTEEQVRMTMNFFSRLSRLFGEIGLAKKKLEEKNDELEGKVASRTRELSAANHHLTAMNEELAATNEDVLKLNENLGRLKVEAEEANQVKSSFLANISHEIRTPMNAILGMTYLIQQTPLSTKQRNYLHKVQMSGQILLSIINDLLDISKIEAGKIELEQVSFRLAEVLDRATAMVGEKAAEKGLDLLLEKEEDIPEVVIGDPLRLNQVLTNLLSNAVKFTESGRISIRVVKITDRQEQITLRFSVQDSGIGLSEQEQAKLFQAFSQIDSSISRRFGGTGLGLAISKRLVDLMGGDIGVKSFPGKGSIFSFTAQFGVGGDPVSLGSEALPELSVLRQKSNLQGCNILVVDDNEINLDVAGELLTGLGVTVTKAVNGKVALKELERGDFDAVLMDVHMPVMDGYQATKALRKKPCWQNLPVIALTASVSFSDREQVIAAGMNDFIKKPISPENLATTLSKWLCPESVPLESSGEREVEESSEATELPIIDIAQTLNRLEGNHRFHIRLLKKFFHNSGAVLENLSQALKDNNIEQVKLIVHDIKGVAGTVGAVRLQAAAAAMEMSLHAGIPEDIATGYEDVSNNLYAAVAAIDAYIQGSSDVITGATHLSPEHVAMEGIILRLREHLLHYETEAVSVFEEIRLHNLLNATTTELELLTKHIDHYNFEDALVLLDKILAGVVAVKFV